MKLPWSRIGLKITGVIVAVLLSCALCRWVLPVYLPAMPGVVHGPFSLEEALSYDWYGPLYRPGDNTPYTNLETTYYYTVSLAEWQHFTYFTGKDEMVRVAKMEHFINVPILYDLNVSEREVPIDWALQGKGWVCAVPEGHSEYDNIPGPPYQSCLYWVTDGQFVLYSIWPQDKAIEFVNALVVVRERPIKQEN